MKGFNLSSTTTYMCKIICVTNRKMASGDFLERVALVAKSGADAIMLREKDLKKEEYLALAEKVRAICEGEGVEFIAHTYIDAAHIGERFHCPLPMLKDVPDPIIVGASCHSIGDVKKAASLGCGYVTVGHIFNTACHSGEAGRGTGIIAAAKEIIPCVYAIGGINESNAEEVINADADGVCVMSGAMTGDAPEFISGLRLAIDKAKIVKGAKI